MAPAPQMLDVLARLVANREKYGKTEVQLGWWVTGWLTHMHIKRTGQRTIHAAHVCYAGLCEGCSNEHPLLRSSCTVCRHELVTTLAETLPPQVSLHTSRRFLKYELLDVDIDHSSDASAPAVSIQLQRAGAPAPDAPVTSRATDQSQLEEGEEVVTASLLVAADG